MKYPKLVSDTPFRQYRALKNWAVFGIVNINCRNTAQNTGTDEMLHCEHPRYGVLSRKLPGLRQSSLDGLSSLRIKYIATKRQAHKRWASYRRLQTRNKTTNEMKKMKERQTVAIYRTQKRLAREQIMNMNVCGLKLAAPINT